MSDVVKNRLFSFEELNIAVNLCNHTMDEKRVMQLIETVDEIVEQRDAMRWYTSLPLSEQSGLKGNARILYSKDILRLYKEKSI